MRNKAIILKWLPASWKSSLAEQYKEIWYSVFNRDQVRLENPLLKESWIADMERQFILAGYNQIVIDSTHMRQKSLESIKTFCQWAWYEVEIVDMFTEIDWYQYHTDYEPAMLMEYLDECLRRNRLREWHKRVPDSVIYQMFLQNYELFDCQKNWYVIVDIDGTVADLTHRLHYLEEKPKNYDAFYDEVDKDLPINQVIDIVRDLSEKYFIVITSGRTNKTCDKTINWLSRNGVPYDALLMKQWYFIQTDIEAKTSIYNKCLKGKNIIMSIDDRPSIVALWRSFWIFTIDVNQRKEPF